MPTSKTRVARPKSSTLAHRARCPNRRDARAGRNKAGIELLDRLIAEIGLAGAQLPSKETPEGEMPILPKPIACRTRASSSTPRPWKVAHPRRNLEIAQWYRAMLSGGCRSSFRKVAITKCDAAFSR